MNATCGKYESEVFCTLSSIFAEGNGNGANLSNEQCGICDDSKGDKAHTVELAVDGEQSWWQSPSLQYGSEYHYVTVTVDLKKVFQVGFKKKLVTLKF